MEASLYIHVPFCAGGKCDYCDFYSVPVNWTTKREPRESSFSHGRARKNKKGLNTLYSPDPWFCDPRPARFVKTLLSEGERLFEKYKPENIPTLYIGGGTPSVLGAAGISGLLGGLSELIDGFSCPAPKEITVEANPESADEAFLSAARGAGVTRLSLGVQAFHGPSRRAVHRRGGEKLLPKRLALAAEFFPAAFSVDLISGLPFQDEKILLDDIAAALSYKPAHVSLYSLIVEAETPLALRLTAAESRPAESFLPGRDMADRLWLAGRDALEKAGYLQYEVSNFCLPGKESLHNIRYWRMRNWLALGPAASGTVINDKAGRGFRFTYPSDEDNWLTPLTEDLDAVTLMKETFLMGFRYLEGPDEDLFRQRFHRNIADCIPKTGEIWRNRGLLRRDKCALTKEGLLLLNRFLIEAFGELDALWRPC